MSVSAASPEARIKAAVIDRLVTGGKVQGDSILISEMTVPNYSRRADIVLANGSLAAYEIKSEADNLDRLAGQIGDMCRLFQTVCVVVAERFETRVLAEAPRGVGVWISLVTGELKERRKAKTAPWLSVEACLELLTVADIRRFLVSSGSAPPKYAMRPQLEEIARGHCAQDLTKVVLAAIKRRYRDRFETFMEAREGGDTLTALPRLKRPARAIAASDECAFQEFEPFDFVPEHPMLIQAPAGPVLKRRRPNRLHL